MLYVLVTVNKEQLPRQEKSIINKFITEQWFVRSKEYGTELGMVPAGQAPR